jgi:hypothetical protein
LKPRDVVSQYRRYDLSLSLIGRILSLLADGASGRAAREQAVVAVMLMLCIGLLMIFRRSAA